MRPIWMPLYVEKFLADTTGLTLAQKGAYAMLLCAMWRSDDGTLPNDDKALSRSAGAHRKHWWQIWPGIKHLFDVDGDLVTSTHLQSELGKSNAIIVARRAAGAIGGQMRVLKASLCREPLTPPKPLKKNNGPQANAQANYNYNIKEKKEREGSPRPKAPSLKEKEATREPVESPKPLTNSSEAATAREAAINNWGNNLYSKRRR